MMKNMRAFVRLAPNTGEVKLIERAVPQPGEQEVLVALRAFGVGIHDRYFIPPQGPYPYTIGTEGAGVVVAAGRNVSTVRGGDRVMMTVVMQPQGGTWAQFVVVPERSLYRLPDTLDFETAAGIPIAGDAAVETLHTLDLPRGATLFIGGGSGAIGTLLIQLATRRGIRIAASASAANHPYVRSLGAELAVDYHDPAWPDQVKQWAPDGVEAALPILPGIAQACMAVVRDGGHLVTVSGGSVSPERGIRVEQFPHRPDVRPDMESLIEEIAAGQVRVVLEQVYEFEEAVAALEKTETRHARGKLVVRAPSQPD